MDKKRFFDLLQVTFVFGLIFQIALLPASESVITVFLDRDFDRATEFLSGLFYFWGPETSGGGTLPGGFFYILLSLSHLLGGWDGMFLLYAILMASGASYLWWQLKKISFPLAWLSIAFIFMTEFYDFMAVFILNPLFMFAMSFFILGLLVKIYCLKTTQALRHWLLMAFLTGLAIQAHMTAGIFLLAALSLELIPRLGLGRLSRPQVTTGFLVFLATLAPHFLYQIGKLAGFSLGQPPLKSVGEIQRAPEWIFQIPGYIELKPTLITALTNFFATFSPLAVLLFCTVIACRKWTSSHTPLKSEVDEPIKSLRTLSLVTLAYLLPVFLFYLLFKEAFLRYLIPFVMAGSLLLSSYISDALLKPTRQTLSLLLTTLVATIMFQFFPTETFPNFVGATKSVIAFAVVFCLIGVVFYFKKDFTRLSQTVVAALILLVAAKPSAMLTNDRGPSLITNKQWKLISEKIYHSTGWNYETVRERIFYVNLYNEMSFRNIYREISEQPTSEKPIQDLSGFFLFKIYQSDLSATSDYKNWLLESSLNPQLKEHLRAGHLSVLSPIQIDSTAILLPYKVHNLNILPDGFHNLGRAYQVSPEAKLFSENLQKNDWVRIGENKYLAQFNDCKTRDSYCNIGFLIEVLNSKNGFVDFGIRIFGEPISQPTEWVMPRWTQALMNPHIQIACNGVTTSHTLIDRIGFHFDKSTKTAAPEKDFFHYWQLQHTFLAPVSRRLRTDCTSPSEITIGYDLALINTDRNTQFEIPGSSLTLQLEGNNRFRKVGSR